LKQVILPLILCLKIKVSPMCIQNLFRRIYLFHWIKIGSCNVYIAVVKQSFWQMVLVKFDCIQNYAHIGWIFSAFKFFVMQSCTTIIIYTFLLESFSLYFVLQQVFFLHSFLPFFLSFSFVLCLIPYIHFWRWLLYYNVFTKAVYNQTSIWLLVG
jgi:hypothetical protein